jgi:Uma2 family endonuclease
MSPSRLHSYLHGSLVSAFRQFPQFSVFVNLTLALGDDDYIPDVCAYPKQPINFVETDQVRVDELPLMIMEIVSPTQTIQEVLEKFPIYFQAGIRSCWLVVPQTTTITVYTAPNQGHIFHAGEVVDPVLNIRLPLDQIFA